MGDGTSATPDWSHGGERFHLYKFQRVDDARALKRISQMPEGELEALWRRRAAVHFQLALWNRVFRWSSRGDWKRLTGWLQPTDRLLLFGEAALNPYSLAYSRLRGTQSAELDLLTFAEEALVPYAPSDDQSVRCDEFSKSRYLAEILGPPVSAALVPFERCPSFDQWARPSQLHHAEVLFAAPSAVRPESLFGHVLLRFVYADTPDGASLAPSYDPVFQIGAMESAAGSGFDYAWRGLTGGLTTVFTRTTLASVFKDNIERDQRTIRRYRLVLSEHERRRLLERAWELERRGFPSYVFASENCASWLLFLINGALDNNARSIARPAAGALVLPTAVLASLRRASRSAELGDGSLVEPIAAPFRSHRELAEFALRGADEIFAQTDGLGVVASAFKDSLIADPLERRARLDILADAVRREAVRNEAGLPLARLLLSRMAVEQYAADVATVALEGERARRAIKPASGGQVPHPAAEAAEAELLSVVSTQQHFARRAGDLLANELVAHDPEELITQSLENLNEAERSRHAFSRPSPGFGVIGLGLYAASARSSPVGFGATASVAAIRERAGDKRTIGFAPETELRVLDFAVGISPRQTALLDFAELKLVRFRSLRVEVPVVSQGLRRHFGFGTGIEGTFDRDGIGRVTGHGLLLATAASPLAENHLTLGFGPMWAVGIVHGHGFRPGARAELAWRLDVAGRHALRSELVYEPGWNLLRRTAEHWVSAEVSGELVSGRWIVRPFGQARASADFGVISRVGVRVDFE